MTYQTPDEQLLAALRNKALNTPAPEPVDVAKEIMIALGSGSNVTAIKLSSVAARVLAEHVLSQSKRAVGQYRPVPKRDIFGRIITGKCKCRR